MVQPLTVRSPRAARVVWLVVVALIAGLLGAVGAGPAQAWGGTASISGTVTGPLGEPAPNGNVYAYTSAGAWAGGTFTDSDGNYIVSGLAAGTYKLRFEPYSTQNYLPEWWNDKTTLENADVIVVADGEAVVDKDAQLAFGATVSGTVTGVGGVGLSGVQVHAYGYIFERIAYSDGLGNFTIKGLKPGSYTLWFDASGSENYLDEYWNDKPSLGTADHFDVGPESVVTGKDAVLTLGGGISGNVKNTSGNNVQLVSVTAKTASGTVGYSTTNYYGDFTILGLAPGSYTLFFSAESGDNYLDEWWNNKPTQAAADYFTVASGATAASKNAVLEPGYTISGSVKGFPNVIPSGGQVMLYQAGNPNEVNYASIGAGGNYQLVGVSPGLYTLRFFMSGNFVPEWWNNKPTQEAADYFTIGSTSVTGKNAVLAVGSTISGHVTGAGSPGPNLQNVLVRACQSPSAYNCSVAATTDASGNYVVQGLAPGSYKLSFDSSSYAKQWWSNKNSFDAAAAVTVGTSTTVTGKDAVLVTGSSISGNLLNSAGSPALGFVSGDAHVWPTVAVFDASTGTASAGSLVLSGPAGTDPESGSYSIAGLGVGTYKVQFLMESTGESIPVPDPASSWVPQWYNGQYSYGAAQTVTISAPGSAIAGVSGVLHNPRFADVRDPSSPFYTYIEWMGSSGISTGTTQPSGNPLYKPVDAVSRQAMALFMYRMSGETFVPPGTSTFADVDSSSQFYTAVEWMFSKGISTGTVQPSGKPLFNPSAAVSRQSMALFVARYAGASLGTPPTVQRFADVPLAASSAAAIEWMFVNGISTGTAQPSGLPLYKPADPVSRQAMAAFLYRVDHLP